MLTTRQRLRKYHKMHGEHLRYGIGKIRRRHMSEYMELDADVRLYIDTLPRKQRDVLWLYYVDGLSCTAIGMRMSYSEGHVRRIKHDAVSSLPLE